MNVPAKKVLANYAAKESNSLGRQFKEAAPLFRSEFQRDRDRIIHSGAFRRLVYKTQVFVNHEGDLYRTRMTHSLEVSQIARTIANALNLNETLVEAIALAHDLGHTPFGHAGQDALNWCMKDYGGFEHNLQSLRVVDQLESRYAEFNGLNLTYETREGILKHCSSRNAKDLGDIGRRFIERRQPGLEAQLADLADAIAYNHHDIDDGYRAGLLSLKQLSQVTIFEKCLQKTKKKYSRISEKRLIHETLRHMVSYVINDLVVNTNNLIDEFTLKSIEDIRNRKSYIAGFSENIKEEHQELKSFLRKNLYRHSAVQKMTHQAEKMVKNLFKEYMSDSGSLPTQFFSGLKESTDMRKARKIADYIAGMTDRFAISEYERLL